MRVKVTYELTQKDFYEAVIAYRNRKPRTKWLLCLVVLLGFLLAALILFLRFADPKAFEHTSLLPLFVFVAFLAYIMWGAPLWAAHALYSKRPSLRGPLTMSLDDGGLHFTGNGMVSEVEWRSLVRWFEGVNHFLYCYSPSVFGIVPRRAMTPEQLTEFRAQLTENIKTK